MVLLMLVSNILYYYTTLTHTIIALSLIEMCIVNMVDVILVLNMEHVSDIYDLSL